MRNPKIGGMRKIWSRKGKFVYEPLKSRSIVKRRNSMENGSRREKEEEDFGGA